MPNKLYFLVEVTPAEQDEDDEENADLGPTWHGTPFSDEAAYLANLRTSVTNDIKDMVGCDFILEDVKIMECGPLGGLAPRLFINHELISRNNTTTEGTG